MQPTLIDAAAAASGSTLGAANTEAKCLLLRQAFEAM
jgi:hypothetical protein